MFQLCAVIDYIRNQIKKQRVGKGLTQSDVALDLGITPGAYSKIESGPTEISVKKLAEIAAILEVNIIYFFPQPTGLNKVEEPAGQYNLATKTDIKELNTAIKQLKTEIALLKGKSKPVKKK